MKQAGTRTNVPFRNDIVGSFLRPQELKTARQQFENKEITQEQLTEKENTAITDLVARQKQVGLHAVTDGEFRRALWHLDFMWGLAGVERVVLDKGYQFHNLITRADSARLTGPIGFDGHPFLEHFSFLKKIAGDTVIARQTIPAPAQFLAELLRDENRQFTEKIYPDQEKLFEDISSAYRQTILALYDRGCRNIQLDDCTWGMFCDKNFWEKSMTAGIDLSETARTFLHVNNNAIQNLPEDLVVTTHVCRGNYHSTWATSGGYEPIAETLFGKENVHAYYLEFDTERAGGFEPLRHVSDGKLVVLGLVSSKTGTLEKKEDILGRIHDATEYIPLERLCLSPQCGFASTEEGNVLTEEQQWKKLEFIKEIAEEVWS